MKKLFLGVGVNKHGPDTTRLEGCDNDVKAWKELLIDKYGFNKRDCKKVLTKDANYKRITEELDALISKLNNNNNSIGVFFYAGHGDRYPKYVNGTQMELHERISCRNNFLTDEKLKAILKKFRNTDSFLILVFDCCFAGGIIDWENSSGQKARTISKSSFVPEVPLVEFFPDLYSKNKLLIAGAHKNQLAFEMRAPSGCYHGVFSYHALEIIKRNTAMNYQHFKTELNKSLSCLGKYKQNCKISGMAEQKKMELFKLN